MGNRCSSSSRLLTRSGKRPGTAPGVRPEKGSLGAKGGAPVQSSSQDAPKAETVVRSRAAEAKKIDVGDDSEDESRGRKPIEAMFRKEVERTTESNFSEGLNEVALSVPEDTHVPKSTRGEGGAADLASTRSSRDESGLRGGQKRMAADCEDYDVDYVEVRAKDVAVQGDTAQASRSWVVEDHEEAQSEVTVDQEVLTAVGADGRAVMPEDVVLEEEEEEQENEREAVLTDDEKDGSDLLHFAERAFADDDGGMVVEEDGGGEEIGGDEGEQTISGRGRRERSEDEGGDKALLTWRMAEREVSETAQRAGTGADSDGCGTASEKSTLQSLQNSGHQEGERRLSRVLLLLGQATGARVVDGMLDQCRRRPSELQLNPCVQNKETLQRDDELLRWRSKEKLTHEESRRASRRGEMSGGGGGGATAKESGTEFLFQCLERKLTSQASSDFVLESAPWDFNPRFRVKCQRYNRTNEGAPEIDE